MSATGDNGSVVQGKDAESTVNMIERRQFLALAIAPVAVPLMALASSGGIKVGMLHADKNYLVVIKSNGTVNTDVVEAHVKNSFDNAGVTDTQVGVIVLPPGARLQGIFEVERD